MTKRLRRPAIVAIPDPCLVVLVGAAGAGKTTFAARHFEGPEILSSDGFRAQISGDAADQRATGAAFARLHRELTSRLEASLLTVVDATNIERAARGALLARAKAAGVPAVAIVLDLPTAVVLARNAARTGRKVDESVVRRHLGRMRTTLAAADGGLRAEGFSAVVLLRDPRDLEAISLVREAAAQPT